MITPVRDLEPSVPPRLEAAVMHALAREPRFRPASAADFAQELAGATELPTEPLRPTDVTEPLRTRTFQSVGISSWRWIAGAAAVAVLAVILGLLKLGGGGESSSTPPRPVRIAPPQRGGTPAAEARNLSGWLRAHSR